MSTWSKLVVDLHREGYTPEEIQERIALPWVTEEYVNIVLAQRAAFSKHYRQCKRFQTTIPAEGTLNRYMYDKVQALGGNAVLVEVLKTKSQYALAREWHVHRNAVINYLRDFIRGGMRVGIWHGNYFSVPQMLEQQELIATRGKSRKRKKLTVKDVRNLW